MRVFFLSVLTLLLSLGGFAQADLQRMFNTEKAFERAATSNGLRSAFLEFLASDSVIFRPDAVNGKNFWSNAPDPSPALLIRKTTDADISSNGLLGYTTGEWELHPKGKSGDESLTQFGQFVTIWEKKPDGRFRISVDIGIRHDKLAVSQSEMKMSQARTGDQNKRGRSAADASMNFLRMSMSQPQAVSGAYSQFAADDVRLLREFAAPIVGKKKVITDTRNYLSVDFPKKVAMYESGDMAYVWNACKYSNGNEGIENGNCLQVWKLHKKDWHIVLGVFAPVLNQTVPTLKATRKVTKRSGL